MLKREVITSIGMLSRDMLTGVYRRARRLKGRNVVGKGCRRKWSIRMEESGSKDMAKNVVRLEVMQSPGSKERNEKN